jgi:hypothetical protein
MSTTSASSAKSIALVRRADTPIVPRHVVSPTDASFVAIFFAQVFYLSNLGNTRRQGNRASDRVVRNMLNCAWLESCYEPACAGAAFSQGRRRVELWLGDATAITQPKPAPVEQIALNPCL